MKAVIVGAWAVALTAGAAFAASSYFSGVSDGAKPSSQNLIVGIQYKKVPTVNVPIIADGVVKGYVVANIVFTGDAETMRTLPVPVEVFVRDELFRHIYNDPKLNFARLAQYDVNGMIADVQASVNRRMGIDVVREILIENVNFIDKASIATPAEPRDPKKMETVKNGG